MIRKILVLERNDYDNNYFSIRYRILVDVPLIQRNIKEAINQLTIDYANSDEITAFNNKTISEKIKVSNFVYGSTINRIKKSLEDDYAYEQSLINSDSKWNYYGAYWDGTTWVVS